MLLLICYIFTATLLTVSHCAKQPHILFILADDYGWNDIGKMIYILLTCFN